MVGGTEFSHRNTREHLPRDINAGPWTEQTTEIFYDQSSTAITPFRRLGKLRQRKITYCSEGDPGFELTDLIPHCEVTARKSKMLYLHHGRASIRADRRKKKRKEERKGGRAERRRRRKKMDGNVKSHSL